MYLVKILKNFLIKLLMIKELVYFNNEKIKILIFYINFSITLIYFFINK